MRFKHALQMVFANFRETYKILLYKLIFAVLIIGILYALLIACFGNVMQAAGLNDVLESGYLIIKNIFVDIENSEALRRQFKAATEFFTNYLYTNTGKLVAIGTLIGAFTLIYGFFTGLADFATGQVIDDHMSSLTHRGFLFGLFKNLKTACAYQLFVAVFSLIFIAIEGAITYLILTYTFTKIGFFALFSSLAVILFLQAVSHALISDFMPSLISGGMNYSAALKHSFSRKPHELITMFSLYFVAGVLGVYVYASMAVFTLGTGLIVAVPVVSLFYVALQFVSFYSAEKKKFYISYDNIVIPKELRDEEKLLNKMDI